MIETIILCAVLMFVGISYRSMRSRLTEVEEQLRCLALSSPFTHRDGLAYAPPPVVLCHYNLINRVMNVIGTDDRHHAENMLNLCFDGFHRCGISDPNNTHDLTPKIIEAVATTLAEHPGVLFGGMTEAEIRAKLPRKRTRKPKLRGEQIVTGATVTVE